MVIILFIIPGCDGDTIKPPPPEPEIFADISGYDSLHYEAVVMVIINKPGHQLQFSSYSDISSKHHSMVISIFYLDTNLKAGTFNFMRDFISGKEYAVGSFIVGKGKDEKVFLSDSGTVIISELNGLTINGSFNFFGSDKSKTEHINVQNGILKIK